MFLCLLRELRGFFGVDIRDCASDARSLSGFALRFDAIEGTLVARIFDLGTT
jgi:hypothetical protein